MGGWSVTTSRSTLWLSTQWIRSIFMDLFPVNEVYCLTIPVEWLNAVKPCGTSSLFRSLTKWRNMLLVSMTQSQTTRSHMIMRCRNLNDYIVARLEEHFPNSWQIEGNHKKDLMSFYTKSSFLPLFLVWLLPLVCPRIRMLLLNSWKCFSRKFLTNGYTYSPSCSSYAKSNLTKSFQSLRLFLSFPFPIPTSAQGIH